MVVRYLTGVKRGVGATLSLTLSLARERGSRGSGLVTAF